MKNKISLFLLLTFLGMGQTWGQTTTWTKLANHTDVTSTDTYMIVDITSSNALTSQYGTSTPQVIGVTITGGNTITATVPDALQWKFTASGSNYIIRPKGSTTTALYSTSSNDGVRVGTNSANIWTLNVTSGGYKGFKHVAEGRNLGVYSDQDWRTYTTIHANIAATKIEIFKLVQDFYWDASAGANNGVGGAATWTSQTDTRFSTTATGSASLVAAPTTANIIFEGTAGIVTLGGSPTVASSTFNTAGYTIATSGSAARTLAGSIDLTTKNITISPIATAGLTISGVISGTGAATSTILTKDGAGTLTLSSSGNTFTGKILINDGYIATTGESRFGATPGASTADQITLNGGGISATTGDINFSSNRGIKLNSNGGKFNPSTGRTITLTNVVSGTGDFIKEGAGTVILSGIHTYTGNTTVTAGTLQLSAANRIANTSNIVLNGGTFRTGASTGYAQTVGTLEVRANSTITLGTGNHNLVFSNSSGIIWNGATLTITGWTGTEGTSGTGGKIFIGSDINGLTPAQLSKITFQDFTSGTTILASGEIVPAINLAPYFEIENATGTFGSICVNATSATSGKFDLYGYNLTGDITVGPLNGFAFSINGTDFSNSLTLIPDAGASVAEEIYIRFTPLTAGSLNGNVTISGGGATTTNVPVTGTGIANATPTVTIAITAGTNPKCSEGSVTFTATTAALSGATVAYQWKLNGNNVGSNTTTYSNTALANDDAVDCTIILTGGSCLTATTAASNTITMVVHPIPTTPDAPQITGDRTGCGSVVLTKSNSDWYWQTTATGTATAALNSAATYTASASGTIYVRAKNASDCWSPALTIPIVVNIPVNITANLSTIPRSTCLGGTAFTALSVTATGTGLSYQWYSNTSASTDSVTSTAVGTNSNSFTPPSNVVGTLYYYVVVSGTAPCTAATSNIVEHSVNPIPTAPDAPQITGDRTGCGSVVLTKSNNDWYWQTTATGTATAALNSATTYTVAASGTLYVRAYNGNCWSTALSIPIVVHSPVNITTNLSTTPRSTCLGGTAFTALSVTATGTGLSYQWYSNTSASTDSATSTAVGTNSSSFTPPSNVVGTVYYYAVVSGTAPCTAATSNILEHTVKPVATISSISPASGAPAGTIVTITGSGFSVGTTVKFGTVLATDIEIISTTEIQAVVPDGVTQNGVAVITALECPSTATYIILRQEALDCE